MEADANGERAEARSGPQGRRRLLRWFAIAMLAAAILFAAYLLWAREPAIAPIARPAPASFAPAEIARGEQLARLGDCVSCHRVPPGPAFAGGKGIKTPFGTLYGPNITPDPDVGIGRWSLAAFTRAVRQGVSRDGRHLYPALPYENFSGLTDADVASLYAYLMTRPAVHAIAPRQALIPPTNFRPFLAAWKALFIKPGRFQPPLNGDAVWDRGAYLVETLGHCGACHTPRNLMGAEEGDHPLAGGTADGWKTPPLTRANPQAASWTVDRIERYLRTGSLPGGPTARGPMREVVDNLSVAPPADVHAIAVYIHSRFTAPQQRN